jgi:DNA-binding response OmpR family regulator
MLVAAEVARQEAIKSILVIEDELEHPGSDALDLVILDLLLQTSTGSPSSRSAKGLDRGPPVIVLAVSHVRSKTVCRKLGACDSMTKPFELVELIPRARLRARERHPATRLRR